MRGLWRTRLIGGDALLRCAVLAVIAAYAQTLRFGFVYDDFALITMNPWLQSWAGFKPMFTQYCFAYLDTYVPDHFYRPLYLAWLWAVQHVLGGAPGWFHVAAVLTHVAAVCLAYVFAKTLLQDRAAAAAAALLFAIHPGKVETVAWIAGANEAVQAALVFAALIAYARARSADASRWWWAASVTFFAAALLTKETALVVPGLILAYEIFLARAPAEPRWKMAARLAPFAVVLGLYVAVRTAVLGDFAGAARPVSAANVLWTAPLAFWSYVRQLVWPVHLSPFYPLLDIRHFSWMLVGLPALALLLAAVLYGRWARPSPVLKFAAAWLALTLLPVIVEFAWLQLHDRHLYLPSFAVALMVVSGLQQASARLRWEHGMAAATLALAACMTLISAREARIWDNQVAVFERAVERAPANPNAVALLAETYADAGAPEKAAAALQHGLQYAPRSAKLNGALAHHYYVQGDYQAARPYLERVVAIGGDTDTRSTALYELSVLEWKDGRRAAAEQHLREAIALTPQIAGYWRFLAAMLDSHPVAPKPGATRVGHPPDSQ